MNTEPSKTPTAQAVIARPNLEQDKLQQLTFAMRRKCTNWRS